MLFKLEEFDNTGFAFSCGPKKKMEAELFEVDVAPEIMWIP